MDADGRDAFVYFDNDMKGYAPHDALRLIERLDERAAWARGVRLPTADREWPTDAVRSAT